VYTLPFRPSGLRLALCRQGSFSLTHAGLLALSLHDHDHRARDFLTLPIFRSHPPHHLPGVLPLPASQTPLILAASRGHTAAGTSICIFSISGGLQRPALGAVFLCVSVCDRVSLYVSLYVPLYVPLCVYAYA